MPILWQANYILLLILECLEVDIREISSVFMGLTFYAEKVEGNLGCFQFLAITNNAAMNVVEQMSLLYECASFGYMPKSGFAGSCEKIPCGAEKKVYYFVFGWNILKLSVNPNWVITSVSSFVKFLSGGPVHCVIVCGFTLLFLLAFGKLGLSIAYVFTHVID
ncbi:Protein of unknown function DUF3704 containing protein [Cricetulus griseus]|nr:Protein of unknown function DUF3704 containing protein [Cricetulus griseus]